MTDYMQEPWFLLLKAAVEERGVMAVAEELGWKNHSGTSRVMNGTYGDTSRFAQRVRDCLGGIPCHYSGRHVQRAYCKEQSGGPPPTHSPPRLAHWHACQRCEHRPIGPNWEKLREKDAS
ncbi:MAG: LacI family transcriptional regulator [Gammaproteobacteria bacterium SHHR-1]